MLIRTLPLLFAAVTAQAGTTLETVNKDLSSGGGVTTINTWAQNGMMRVEAGAKDVEHRSTMIFKNDTIYAINHQDKSYYAMDRESMKRMAAQINPALQMLQERMKDMSPEQRAQVEKMMGGKLPPAGGEPENKTQIKRTTRADKISGYSCTYVQVLDGGVLTDEMCVTPAKDIKGSDELMTAATRMASLMREMMSAMNAPWLKQMAEKQVQNFNELGGIPVFSRHFVAGEVQSETTLTSIRSEAIAASRFELPAGYAKKDMLGAAAP
ncbi:MAG: DUF4412 domain-containing protein [Steroidobacter sp.]